METSISGLLKWRLSRCHLAALHATKQAYKTHLRWYLQCQCFSWRGKKLAITDLGQDEHPICQWQPKYKQRSSDCPLQSSTWSNRGQEGNKLLKLPAKLIFHCALLCHRSSCNIMVDTTAKYSQQEGSLGNRRIAAEERCNVHKTVRLVLHIWCACAFPAHESKSDSVSLLT